MVINVASFGGRTHMLDTARELEKFGHTVRFYSYVPTKRAIRFGLKKECNYSLFYWALPFLMLFRIFGQKGWTQFIYRYVFDYFTAWYMKPCDVFIGQSPMHRYSLKYAKKKYNAIVILERGTSHVIEEINNLSGNPALKGNLVRKDKYIKTDLKGYELADYISVGAEHVKNSFIINGFDANKIFVNNYGVDLSQFSATICSQEYDLMQVGNWGYRKGADLITEVCRLRKYSFLHVGSTNIPFPTDVPSMAHIGITEQYELIKYYSKAKVFILPSREEGLALVQVQAVACGLPLVCSKKSGGIDLKKYVDSEEYIIEIENLDTDSLICAIDKALTLAEKQKGKRYYATEKLKELSWEGYGRRYNDFLKTIF